MLDFNPTHFTSTFNSSPYYNGDINGFDIMVMQSAESADELIEELKKEIDNMKLPITDFTIDFDDEILLNDRKRVEETIKNYINQKNNFYN